MTKSGIVYLVGAGPGDPGLITLRGVECLQRADVVLYDYLVNASMLRHLPARAESICLGRHGRASIWPQTAINARLVAEAEAGRTVVRLKCGDPLVFGRASEELQALASRGIAFEIVPGVTAALAAGAYAGIPLTHRDHASAVALVTGQENAEKTESLVDFDALARFPGTIVVYMGVTSARGGPSVYWRPGSLRKVRWRSCDAAVGRTSRSFAAVWTSWRTRSRPTPGFLHRRLPSSVRSVNWIRRWVGSSDDRCLAEACSSPVLAHQAAGSGKAVAGTRCGCVDPASD